jgi:diacylglycerol kinase (ATP)
MRSGAGLGTVGGHGPWFGGTVYAGFDAVVNARANQLVLAQADRRATTSRWCASCRSSARFPYVIETDDGTRHDTEAMLVVVANVRSYGGGMRVAPDALPDDGLLDVLVLHRLPRHEFVRVFPTVFSGGHVGHPAVELLQGAPSESGGTRHTRLRRWGALHPPPGDG